MPVDFSAAQIEADEVTDSMDVASREPRRTSAEVASPEVASPEVKSPARRNLFAMGALAAAGVALAGVPARADFGWDYGDAQALRFLEELELLQTDFYTRAALSAAGASLDGRQSDAIRLVAQQDGEQLDWIRRARGKLGVAEYGRFYQPNTAMSRPHRSFTFSGRVFEDRGQMLSFAVDLKETAVAAYQSAVALTDSAALTQAVAALAGIESRHAAALREANGDNPLPRAFETQLSPTDVLHRLASFGFRGEATR
jgi:hypothetical protein